MKPAQRNLYRIPVRNLQNIKVHVEPPPLPTKNIPIVKQQIQTIHTFYDNSKLRLMSAKDLAKIDIWHSQRTLDVNHKNHILSQVEKNIQNLDGSLYHIVRYPPDEETEEICRIIDGQHRATILKDYFEKNTTAETFFVLVKEKFCETEDEAIQYFKILNTTKAIEWKEDPKLLCQKYLKALFDIFQNDTNKFFRITKTKKPFIQIEKLEQALVQHLWQLNRLTPTEFAEEVFAWNERKLEILAFMEGRTTLQNQAIEKGFALGLDDTFSWLDNL